VSQCDDNVQALLPREENRTRTIRYQRPTPPVPATYADVRLPEEYTTTEWNPDDVQLFKWVQSYREGTVHEDDLGIG
jgi:hypothetical protein